MSEASGIKLETQKTAGDHASTITPQASRLSVIVAMARNRVIGAGNKIPWHLPAELKLFKTITMGHHIIMGRNTWESIGRLLPGRTSVVVTRQPGYRVEGAVMAASLEAAITARRGDDEIFIIGGAQLYAAAMPLANRLYLTIVAADVAGDAYMPEFDLGGWQQRSAQAFAADEKNFLDYVQTVYEKVP
jgi:dihydrofolate reductase